MAPVLGRWLRSRVLVVLVLGFAFAAYLHNGVNESPPPVQQPVYPNQAFHLLVPATSSNDNFCRLLLSAAINRYPVPILINWGAKENKDAYVQHLAKVWTILDYLEIMLQRGQKDDLVLIIDGFDIHFQLPPEVIISRYYAENERANKRIEAQLGAEVAAAKGIKQTVIFGHDKLCWPTDWRRPACWLVPEASDPRKAYGPLTDATPTLSRARWLNSGTILGPVDHVRDIFRATLDLIHRNHTTDSDQFYFANILADQEHSRHLEEANPYAHVNKAEKDFPDLIPGNRTEYFFGLDYEGVLFQTMAFFREFLVWETFDGVIPKQVSSIWKASNKNQRIIKRDPYYLKVLPDDIANARPPFSAILERQPPRDPIQPDVPADLVSTSLPVNTTWRNLSLGVNANSNQIFPLLHFTGPKEFRRKWWPRLWFIPWAEELLKANTRAPRRSLGQRPIGGKLWWSGQPSNTTLDVEWEEKGGAWGDRGQLLGWDLLCKEHEDIVFNRIPPELQGKGKGKSKDDKAKDEEPKDEKPKEEKPQEEKAKDEKPVGEKPNEEKPQDGKPKEEKPKEEQKPTDEKPTEDKPKEDPPKPEGEKSQEGKPQEEKPKEDKPQEGKPQAEKPKEEKPTDEKPTEEKPQENKPDEAKPQEEKPQEEQSKEEKVEVKLKEVKPPLDNPQEDKPKEEEKPQGETPQEEKPKDTKVKDGPHRGHKHGRER